MKIFKKLYHGFLLWILELRNSHKNFGFNEAMSAYNSLFNK